MTVQDQVTAGKACPHATICKACYASWEAFEAMFKALAACEVQYSAFVEQADAETRNSGFHRKGIEHARAALALADKVRK